MATDYIVSARKYRPATFSQVIGQEALTTTLKNSVTTGKLAHAYLFCGPRGVGKTTCARIFAKAINCLNPQADGEACGTCESCTAFDQQRSYNIFELDAASNNSVDNIKSLMEQTRIPPQVGRYKVFIIDEVHMLSQAAFNAFLKTLEEPPAHVIFVLATTEKNKILPTILSRCQIYDFDRMAVDDIVRHLKNVAQKEGVTTEESALELIAEKADGGMRDALSIFDQAASFCNGNITYKNITAALNVPDADNYFDLTDFCNDGEVTDAIIMLNDLINKGHDGAQIISGLAKHVRNVLMAKDTKTIPLLEVSQKAKEKYAAQAAKCPTKFLYKALKLMNDCDINYKASNNKRLTVELTLIQMAQINQDDDDPAAGRSPRRLKNIFNRSDKLNRARVGKKVPQQPEVAPQQQQQQASQQQQQSAQQQAKQRKHAPITFSWNALKGNVAEPPTTQLTLFGNEQNATADKQTTFTGEELTQRWIDMCDRMPQEMSGLASRLRNALPTITEMPNVELVVGNALLAEQIEGIKARVQATLRHDLNNSNITLTIRTAEPTETEQVLTRSEMLERMRKENNAIERLCEMLDLELA